MRMKGELFCTSERFAKISYSYWKLFQEKHLRMMVILSKMVAEGMEKSGQI